jgi:5'(3')-deoxyribonucleotidase
MLRIGLDIDGILRDFNSEVDSYIENYLNYLVKIPGTEHFYDLLKRYDGITDKELFTIFNDKSADNVMISASPYSGAISFYNKLKNLPEVRIVIVTKQGKISGYKTLEWLGRYRIDTPEVHIIRYGESKLRANVDLLIDDDPHNLQEFIDHGIPAVGMQRPWNKHYDVVPIFETYNDLFEYLKKFIYSIKVKKKE